jgi:hypothetical protein
MPRRSAEDVAGALWRAGSLPPKPPAHLSRQAKAIWREIAGSRPADYFRAGNLVLLEQLCGTTAELRRLWPQLEAMPEGRERARQLHLLCNLSALQARLCSELKLLPRHDDGRKMDQGIGDEAGAPLNPLIGGYARERH